MGSEPDHGVCHVSHETIGSLEDVEREIQETIGVHEAKKSMEAEAV